MKISEIIKKNKKSVVLIAVSIPEGENKTKVSIRGTGFIISKDGKFITCGHVYKQIPPNEFPYLEVAVEGKTDEKTITHYDRYKVKFLDIDDKNDVALMQIISDKKDFETMKEFGESELVEEGDEAIFIGYPLATELLGMGLGVTITTSYCIISAVKRRMVDGSLDFFIVDTHINNGSSGSPLFSKDSGKVIGIASGKISAKIPAPDGRQLDIPANMGICRPAEYAVNLINKNR